jgi:hypothetical protein
MQRILIGLGLSLTVLGLIWPWVQKLGLGHLPGDIVIERETFRFYFPITTMLLVSIVLSLIIWWLRK